MKKIRLMFMSTVVVMIVLAGLFSNATLAHRHRQAWQEETIELELKENNLYGAVRTPLANDLFDMMEIALEDEYLALTTYLMIMDAYEVTNPFASIARSEVRHIASLHKLFEAYDLDIPEDRSAEFVKLPASLVRAFEAGIHAEIENIAMYEAFLNQELPTNVRNVFNALTRASENHLKAFERGLEQTSNRQATN